MPQQIEIPKKAVLAATLLMVFLAFGGVGGCMFGYPYYNVYHQHMEGRAMLAKAEYSKQVLVQEALARKESAKSLAEAEVTRAEGVAKANKIIGESLRGNREYLQYLWIHNLEEGNHDTVYVATEAGLPIFDMDRRKVERTSVHPGEPPTGREP